MKKFIVGAVAAALLAFTTANASGPLYPFTSAVAVVPNDTTNLPQVALSLWIGGAGNLNVDMYNGQTVLISGITAGTLLPIKVRRVRATTTTATAIVAFY